ncbi:MAG TPA: CDP-diacylglycerol--serine O-phosphatidyltransferase [Candidatus Limnocylindria bacterium]|nr:CDP-diacylglycerol--serine O-phosphatidyltransferase [Candidatus Limnocylindria bacterium]
MTTTKAPVVPFPRRRRRGIPPLRKGVYLLPNLFTSAGLFAGFYSIICTLRGDFHLSAIMILVAQFCDVLDGRIARLTRTSSSFGVQYDSLADLIAFGVAPGVLVWSWALEPWGRWGWLAATVYVTCGALRLARFNVQVGSVERRHFVGLPTPAAADVVASTVLIYFYFGGQGAANKMLVMPLLILGLAALMVSEVRYFSFKEFQLHHRHPFPVLLAALLLIVLTIAEPELMLFVVATTYALSGPVGAVVRFLVRRRHARRPPPAAGDDAGAVRPVRLA